jgi:hypothetical protein
VLLSLRRQPLLAGYLSQSCRGSPVTQHVNLPTATTSVGRQEASTSPIDTGTVDQPKSTGADSVGSRGRSRWLLPALLAVGFLLHVAWRVFLSRDLITPAAHADEDGYLIAARALTGGAGGITTENWAFRRMGYPLIISPVYWFTTDAFSVYRAVLVLNAFLNALAFPLVYLFARRVLDLPRRLGFVAAFVAAALPAVVFYANFAMTDAVLAPIGLGWLLLLHRWLAAGTDRGRLVGALGSGAFAGLFFLVHVRGVMVVLTHGLIVAVLLLLRKVRWRTAFATVGAVAAVGLIDPVLKLIVGDALVEGGKSPKGQTVNAVTTLDGILRTFGGATGQIWYLCVATLGIGAIGFVATVVPLWNRTALRAELADRAVAARRIVLTAVLFTTVFVALGSSAALPTVDNRINYYAYPRYIHLLFPVWLLIGILALHTARTNRRLLWLAGGAAGLTVVTGAVVLVRVRAAGWGLFLGFDAPETSFLGWRWDSIGIARPTAVALAFFAVIVAVVLWRRRVGLGALMAGFLAVQVVTMPFVIDRVVHPMEDDQYVAGTPRLVRDGYVRPGDVVGFARRQQQFYWLYNHAREVWWSPLLAFNQDTQPVPAAATVVVAPWQPTAPTIKHWDGTQFGFHLVVADPHHHWALWRRGPG